MADTIGQQKFELYPGLRKLYLDLREAREMLDMILADIEQDPETFNNSTAIANLEVQIKALREIFEFWQS
jgi:hypothetical protein